MFNPVAHLVTHTRDYLTSSLPCINNNNNSNKTAIENSKDVVSYTLFFLFLYNITGDCPCNEKQKQEHKNHQPGSNSGTSLGEGKVILTNLKF